MSGLHSWTLNWHWQRDCPMKTVIVTVTVTQRLSISADRELTLKDLKKSLSCVLDVNNTNGNIPMNIVLWDESESMEVRPESPRTMKPIQQWSCDCRNGTVRGSENRPNCPHCKNPMGRLWEVVIIRPGRRPEGIGAVRAESRTEAFARARYNRPFGLKPIDVRPWLVAQR